VRNTGRLRGRIEVRLGNGVTIGSRLERLSLDPGGEGAREEGTMLYEDAGIVPAGFCSLRLRVVLFGTGSYDSRLYEFEDDLPGTLSMPALFGRGDRWYLLLRMEAGKGRGLSVKYSRLERDDVRRIGTGPDELPGNSDERVGVQLDFTL
jgi:hypothetical protein